MDKKISEETYLPAADFDGTEEFLLAQGGSNYKTKSGDLKGITQISRANLISLRDAGTLTRGFYHIIDSTPQLIVFAPSVQLISKWAHAMDSNYNKFIEYDLDADAVKWMGEFLRQPVILSTTAGQLDYSIPDINGWTIAIVQLENEMLTPSQYTLSGSSFTLVIDAGDVADGMYLAITGYKS
jgi:hypothetical protein